MSTLGPPAEGGSGGCLVPAGHPTSTAVIVTNSDDLPEMKQRR